ncbi:hypothetical protein B0H19DRAFT_984317 [Mycena capillaripes]|nr:hypothetical protein B0H19DRAFT_984317 [Mycena capillaripes]
MTDPAVLQEVEGLWFHADLIILQAGNRIFRVFTTILKEKSPVFADLFSLPQPDAESAAVETIGGVPVVKMHDDPAELEMFLKAIFDSNFFMPPPTMTRIEVIVGVLRLAHKYDVSFLRHRALEHLGTVYCTRLEDYHNGANASYDFDSLLDANLKVIQVLVQVGASWLLPDAYYTLYNFSPRAVLSAGVSLREAEKDICLRVFSDGIRRQPFAAILSFLSISKTEESLCNSWTLCNTARLATIQNYPWSRGFDIFDVWGENNWADLEGKGLCELCLEEAQDLHQRGKQKFWDELPKVFGLPDWATLEQMREAALA